MRRFHAEQAGALNEVKWRIVPGKKEEDDLRLDIWTPEWRAVPMALVFLAADFFTENERVLYRNGDPNKFMNRAEIAVHFGWRAATAILEEEKRRKRNGDAP